MPILFFLLIQATSSGLWAWKRPLKMWYLSWYQEYRILVRNGKVRGLLRESTIQVYVKMAWPLCYSTRLTGVRSGFLTPWNTACFHSQPCFSILQLKTENSLHLWLNLLPRHLLTLIESFLCVQHLTPLFNLHNYASRCVLLSPKYRVGNWDWKKLNPESGKTHSTARNHV